MPGMKLLRIESARPPITTATIGWWISSGVVTSAASCPGSIVEGSTPIARARVITVDGETATYPTTAAKFWIVESRAPSQ
jgi:hypothetical protein